MTEESSKFGKFMTNQVVNTFWSCQITIYLLIYLFIYCNLQFDLHTAN